MIYQVIQRVGFNTKGRVKAMQDEGCDPRLIEATKAAIAEHIKGTK